jgi:acetyltransferase-like isoleucine patch superfamily enzyme
MHSLFKKIVPGFLKSFFWQIYLRIRFTSDNQIGKKVIFSKDLIIGKNCRISDQVIFGESVKLSNNISIGKNVLIANLVIGNDSIVDSGVIFTGYGEGRIKIGENCYIGLNNILDWSHNITIGDYVHIAGPSTGLWTHSSAPMCLNGIPLDQKSEKFRPTAPIVIEDNVYIGGNCTIYPGITIGHHSIVAPNSAVTKNVESFSLVGGVPAKIIKKIDFKQNGLTI